MQPTLVTSRLILRPFTPSDAPRVQALAGDRRISDTTTTIPHPYPDGAAEAWIAGHAAAYEHAREATFAVELASTAELVGAVSLLDVRATHARAELGYWIGVPYWGRGYCTEAAMRLIQHAGDVFAVTRVAARCFVRNSASASVLIKSGLKQEGLLPKHALKNGAYEDVLLFGVNLPGRDEARPNPSLERRPATAGSVSPVRGP